MSALKERITLQSPAETYEGLRAQASLLNITGRGSMRKPALIEAVTAAIAAYHAEHEAARVAIEAQRQEAIQRAERTVAPTTTPAPETIHIDVHPTVAAVIAAALNYQGTRTTGRRGASLLMTREGRKDYPASSKAKRNGRAKRRGRK